MASRAKAWTPICEQCHARPKMDRCDICEECWYAPPVDVQEAAAVRMMLEMGTPPHEVAEWTLDARRRRAEPPKETRQ